MPGYIGESILPEHDLLLTTGRGTYVADANAPGRLVMAVLRSTYAHARLLSVDVSGARARSGVVGAFSARDLPEIDRPMPAPFEDPRLQNVLNFPLADGTVRYLGEAVAVVLADSRYAAEDALEHISVDYDPLPVLVDPEARAPVLHPEVGTNVVGRVENRFGDPDGAFAAATHVIEVTLRLSRIVAHPMEPRGILVTPLPDGSLDVLAATQGPHSLRRLLAAALRLDPAKIRVHLPDIGGGFGVKNRIYPEDVLAAHLAQKTGRPVLWTGDRREEFLATIQERDQIHRAAIALSADGTLLAVRDHFIHDAGAYTTAGLIVASSTAVCIPGPYRLKSLDVVGDLVVTNKAPTGPYRGAGRPQAAFVMERLMDRAADAIGMDRLDLRRKNLITPDEIPYTRPAPAGGFGGAVYDSGDFPASLEKVVKALGPRPKASFGKRIGLGIACCIENASGFGFEDARLTLDADGGITVRTGTSSQGHDHVTTFAQIAADRLGVPIGSVRVVEGDTGEIGRGIGTFGSRSTIMAGNAVSLGAQALREKILAAAAQTLEVSVEDIAMARGEIAVKGAPSRSLSLKDVAARAGAIESQETFESSASTYAMGTHGALVEIDEETRAIRILRYVICHDAGVVVNPLLADGQTIGGAVQGIATALFEELATDARGQVLNTSLADYILPLATDVPDFELIEDDHPASTNPEGVKGIGEGGTIPSAAAVVSAVEDALRDEGVRIDAIPITPAKLFTLTSKRTTD